MDLGVAGLIQDFDRKISSTGEDVGFSHGDRIEDALMDWWRVCVCAGTVFAPDEQLARNGTREGLCSVERDAGDIFVLLGSPGRTFRGKTPLQGPEVEMPDTGCRQELLRAEGDVDDLGAVSFGDCDAHAVLDVVNGDLVVIGGVNCGQEFS